MSSLHVKSSVERAPTMTSLMGSVWTDLLLLLLLMLLLLLLEVEVVVVAELPPYLPARLVAPDLLALTVCLLVSSSIEVKVEPMELFVCSAEEQRPMYRGRVVGRCRHTIYILLCFWKSLNPKSWNFVSVFAVFQVLTFYDISSLILTFLDISKCKKYKSHFVQSIISSSTSSTIIFNIFKCPTINTNNQYEGTFIYYYRKNTNTRFNVKASTCTWSMHIPHIFLFLHTCPYVWVDDRDDNTQMSLIRYFFVPVKTPFQP